MKCSKCGTEISEELNFCPNCGNNLKENGAPNITEANIIEETPKNEEIVNDDPLKGSYEIPKDNNVSQSVQQPDQNDDQLPTTLCIISLVLYFLGSVVAGLIPGLGPIFRLLSPLVAIGIMIYVRVKYPNNTFGKVLMILYIVLTILAIIGFILVVMLCKSVVQSCGSLG